MKENVLFCHTNNNNNTNLCHTLHIKTIAVTRLKGGIKTVEQRQASLELSSGCHMLDMKGIAALTQVTKLKGGIKLKLSDKNKRLQC